MYLQIQSLKKYLEKSVTTLLVETEKPEEYFFIDRLCRILTLVFYDIFHYFNMQVMTIFLSRLIRLVLTLPVPTATTDCAFSAMKLDKTML
jgi:hypothetical protein